MEKVIYFYPFVLWFQHQIKKSQKRCFLQPPFSSHFFLMFQFNSGIVTDLSAGHKPSGKKASADLTLDYVHLSIFKLT